MNTLCGPNTELSRCVTNLFNPHLGLAKFNACVLGTRLLPLFSNNSIKEAKVWSKKSGISLSVSSSGTKNVVETAEGSMADGLTYKDAGVDIDAGSELVKRIAKMAPGIGGFGGLFPLGDSYLVAGTDGVGTKLKLAFETEIHETIGIDLVAMSVNDIVTSGAKPLFFLDYFATSHLDVDLAEKVIKGIVSGCQQSDCALLGGETAEMPDFYADGEYDLSGFAVGIVKKESVIDGKNITVGDVLLGLPSSGVHSNGFSLVRRVLKQSGLSLKDQLPGSSVTLGEALMAPTCIYVKQVLDIISKGGVKGIAHITGGGFTDNIPRVFPKGLGAIIYKDSWVVPPVFKWIQEVAAQPMKRKGQGALGARCDFIGSPTNLIMVTSTSLMLFAGRFGLAPSANRKATAGLKLEVRDSGLQTGDPAGFTLADTLACGTVGHIIGVGVVLGLKNIGAI